MTSPQFSVIIPVKKLNNYLTSETIPALLKQTYSDYEIIIITDKPCLKKYSKTTIIPSWPQLGPSDKRNLGAKMAKGKILAFIDDDSYPSPDWLEQAHNVYQKLSVSAVCGPSLTPPNDSIYQKASGYVWSTWFGSGGAGTYRCTPQASRKVDDYPTVNLFVKKSDFRHTGGFNLKFWPGEDTELCHKLVYLLHQKIIYDPNIVVYHHRRPVYKQHLVQISRYALHRGYFARILPRTSLRIGYLIPSMFLINLILSFYFFIQHGNPNPLLAIDCLYLVLLVICSFEIFINCKNLRITTLSTTTIFLTHIYYGYYFILGFFTPHLEDQH